MAKDFSNIDGGRVFDALETSTSRRGQQGEASQQEATRRADALKTQGRKGCKAIRINMAFTPQNHEFIKIMAAVTGQSMTEFCNFAVEQYREEHADTFDAAKAIKDSLHID